MDALRHNRLLAPVLTTALAVAFSVFGLASELRDLAEVHAICAEHGELIHLDEAARGTACETAGALQSAPSSGHAGDHAHCRHPVDQRRISSVGEAVVLADAPTVAIAAPVYRVTHGEAVALYLLAPKASPPISAS